MRIYILFLVVLLFGLYACEKDRQIVNYYCPTCEPCENIPKDTSPFGRGIFEPFNQRKAPCYNPLNNDEFVFIKEQDSTRHSSLVKYNLATRAEMVILDNVSVSGQPKWAKNGWVVFAGLNLNIYKIKANGDSLSQLTSDNNGSDPEVYNDDKILFSLPFSTPNKIGSYIIDFSGKIIDNIKVNATTFNGAIAFNSINTYQELAGNLQYNIVVYTLKAKQLTKITNDTGINRRQISGVCWHPNDMDVYYSTWGTPGNSTYRGIYKINKNSKEDVLIKKGCDARGYSFLSISPNGKKILVERQDATFFLDKNTVIYGSDIYIMDIDGRNEEKVFK